MNPDTRHNIGTALLVLTLVLALMQIAGMLGWIPRIMPPRTGSPLLIILVIVAARLRRRRFNAA